MQEVGKQEHPGGGEVRGWSRIKGGGRVSHPHPYPSPGAATPT